MFKKPEEVRLSDKELVKESLKNPESYFFLMKRYEAKLFRYINTLTGFIRENCEDILQNTFIKAYRNLNSYNPSFAFSTWIYRIARNESISYLRKHKREPVYVESVDQSKDLFETIASEVDLHKELEDKNMQLRVTTALYKLNVKYREALVLRLIEDKSYEEIAEILHKPINTVSTLLSRGKALLKNELKDLL